MQTFVILKLSNLGEKNRLGRNYANRYEIARIENQINQLKASWDNFKALTSRDRETGTNPGGV